MIYLSYFNNRQVRNSSRKKYSIARYQFIEMEKAEELLVPNKIFKRFKSKEISFEDLCTAYYLEVLMKLNPIIIGSKYDEAILCCHEVKECHRVLLMHWLNTNGIKAKEYEGE